MGTILSVLGSVIVKILLLLLFLVLFVLVLAGCILWVPVRYCFYGNYGEEKVLQGKASWLLHLVHAQIRYQTFSIRYQDPLSHIPLPHVCRK